MTRDQTTRQPLFGIGASLAAMSLAVVTVAAASAAQAPAPTPAIAAQIANLSSLDYPTRMNAARVLRRTPQAEAVPALTEAVRRHRDEFVRNRAFIVLTSFNDRGTGDLAREVIADRNDRLRESAYKWIEQHPDPRLIPTLLAALQTEQAEFVRPALVGALAAHGTDPQAQRALVAEVSRGLDFFRSAVIDALGRHNAAYAVDAVAPITRTDGPLQQDAVLAVGRIAGARADQILTSIAAPPPDVAMTIRAATCVAGRACETQLAALVAGATAARQPPAVVKAAVSGLGAIAESGNTAAIRALLELAGRAAPLRDEVAVTLGMLAVRRPAALLDWLDTASAAEQDAATALLKDGFDTLDEDYGEEQFFAATRAMYWQGAENSATRTLTAALIQRLEF